MTLPDLCARLELGQIELADLARGLPEENFFQHQDNRWRVADHLGHLQAVYSAVGRGLNAMKRLPLHSSGQSRNYEAVKAAYQEALKKAPEDFLQNNPFVTPSLEATKPERIHAFLKEGQQLLAAAKLWTEAELDQKAMQHPLLGELSVREMLMFIHYHDQHHLSGLKRRLKIEESV